jgi:hypothetical protein
MYFNMGSSWQRKSPWQILCSGLNTKVGPWLIDKVLSVLTTWLFAGLFFATLTFLICQLGKSKPTSLVCQVGKLSNPPNWQGNLTCIWILQTYCQLVDNCTTQLQHPKIVAINKKSDLFRVLYVFLNLCREVDFTSVWVGIAFKRCLLDPIFKNGFEIFDQFSLKKFFLKTGAAPP